MTTLANGATTGSGSSRAIDNSKDVARKFGTSALADDAVTAAKLASGAVGAVDIADATITAAKLAANAVTTAKITDLNVTTGKLAAGVVSADAAGRALLAAGVINEATSDSAIVDGAVNGGKVKDATVANAKLVNATITKAKTAMFVSTEQTGNGSSQNVAHGLGGTPTAVLIVPTDTAPATAGVYTAVEGAHDGTNVKVTVTSGKKYKVWAML